MLDRMTDWPAPNLQEPLYRGYWEASIEGQVRVQRCADCSTYNWPPRGVCPTCYSENLEWSPIEPVGTVFSWIVVGFSKNRGFTETPYVVAIVQIDGLGIRMLGDVDADPTSISRGLAVTGRFVPTDEPTGLQLLRWSPA
jgi:uncharacterized OB-fold protein